MLHFTLSCGQPISNQVAGAKPVNPHNRHRQPQQSSKPLRLRYSESRGYPVERRLRVGEGLHVRVLRVRRLELVDVAVHEGGRLVEVAAAADEVHERVRVVLALADGLDGMDGMDQWMDQPRE